VLDPQTAGLLSLIESANAPALAQGTAEQARAGFRTLTVHLRDPSTLAPVRDVQDRTLPDGTAVRVYRPDVDGPVPTVLFFHGGGFVLGDLDTHEDQARLLCRDVSAVVMSVDYPLAPEAPFPAGFDACLAATRWAADSVDELGGDPGRLAVAGDSAGGNLAAAVALAVRQTGPRLAAQLLIYPAVDLDEQGEPYASRVDNAVGYFLTAQDMGWFAEQYLPAGIDRRDPRVSVLHVPDLAGVAPAVIGTGEYDPLRDEGDAYAERLGQAGVPVRHHRFPGLIHGFYGFGTFSAASADAVAALNADLKDLLG